MVSLAVVEPDSDEEPSPTGPTKRPSSSRKSKDSSDPDEDGVVQFSPEMDAELDRIDAVFSGLLDLIPLEHYGFDQETREAIRERKHAIQNAQMHKKNINIKRSVKHKMSRADDSQLQTVSQVLHWLAERGDEAGNGGKGGAKRTLKGAKGVAKHQKGMSSDAAESISRQDLLEKLHGRLTEFKQNRKATAVDYKEKQRLKRRMNRAKSKLKVKQDKLAQRQGISGIGEKEAGKRKADVDDPDENPVEAKKLKKTPKKSKLELLREKTNAAQSPSSKSADRNAAETAVSVGPPNTPRTPSTKSPKSAQSDDAILNSDGKVVYSKFDFAVAGVTKNRKPKGKLAGKDFQTLLKKVGKQKEKLDQLRSTDPEKAVEFEKKLEWQAALDRAEGLKVKDNPDLLKKSIASKEKRKNYTLKKWDDRKKSVQALHQKKEDKRTRNLNKRKNQKKEKGIERAKKKGRYVPGF